MPLMGNSFPTLRMVSAGGPRSRRPFGVFPSWALDSASSGFPGRSGGLKKERQNRLEKLSTGSPHKGAEGRGILTPWELPAGVRAAESSDLAGRVKHFFRGTLRGLGGAAATRIAPLSWWVQDAPMHV